MCSSGIRTALTANTSTRSAHRSRGRPWVEVVPLSFPSGRTAEEVVPRDGASLAWMANLACLELHPHPVRADDLDHPDELRIDLDPVPGVAWAQVREVASIVRPHLADFGLVGWPKTSGSRGIHVYVRIERRWVFTEVRRAALAFAREVERRAPTLATSKWWKEERHGVFLDYNQNAKDRTIASAYSVRPKPDARVSAPLSWDEVRDCEPEDFNLATMPKRFGEIGDRHAEIDRHTCSLEALFELSKRHEKEGMGDAPWPPQYKKQAGEPARVQPSREAHVEASPYRNRSSGEERGCVRRDWSGGVRDIPMPPHISSRRTFSSTRCGGGLRRGPGSASISNTSPTIFVPCRRPWIRTLRQRAGGRTTASGHGGRPAAEAAAIGTGGESQDC